MGKIFVGISSWADAGLVKSDFYPKNVKTAEERLAYYSRLFPIAEVDSSFHFFPTRRNIEMWLQETPPGFIFDIRAFSLFSGHPSHFQSIPRSVQPALKGIDKENIYIHHFPPEATSRLWEIFVESIRPVAEAKKLGVVLLQFPPWFHPNPESMTYIRQCKKNLLPYQLAIEFRVGSWMDPQHRAITLALLRELEISLVCVDEPQGLRSSMPPEAETTSGIGVVRFHGRNKEAWESKSALPNEKFNYYYKADELKEWLPGIREMAEKANQVHVIFKNKYRDYSANNALEMQKLLY
jgi:uncharacterized protein YecE (DUF72 family)